jgi:hypothetical protein
MADGSRVCLLSPSEVKAVVAGLSTVVAAAQ